MLGRSSNWLILIVLFVIFSPEEAFSQDVSGIPFLSVEEGQKGEQEYTVSLRILLFMTALTLLPSLLPPSFPQLPL